MCGLKKLVPFKLTHYQYVTQVQFGSADALIWMQNAVLVFLEFENRFRVAGAASAAPTPHGNFSYRFGSNHLSYRDARSAASIPGEIALTGDVRIASY